MFHKNMQHDYGHDLQDIDHTFRLLSGANQYV